MIRLCVNGSWWLMCAQCASLHLLLLEFICALEGKVFGLFAGQQVNGLRNIKT